MKSESMIGTNSEHEPSGKKLSLLETYILLSAHPRKLALDLVSIIWAGYFLWHNDLYRALVFASVISVVGLITVLGANPIRIAATTLGKLALLHLHPGNLIIQALAILPVAYGLWIHSAELLLIGFSALLLGHVFGWEKVDSRFSFPSKSLSEEIDHPSFNEFTTPP